MRRNELVKKWLILCIERAHGPIHATSCSSPIGAIIQRFVSTLIDSFSVSVTNYEAN